MPGFDRRTVITGTVVTGVALAVPGAPWATGQNPAVFVVDWRFASSAAAAFRRASLGTSVIDPRQDDLGIAWRERIPKLLEQNGPVIEGVTLWSDLLICETFARAHGLEPVRPAQSISPAPADGLQFWTLAEPGFPYRLHG